MPFPNSGNEMASEDMANTEPSSPCPATVVRHLSSGIFVLIVGAGIGGLMAALECWRKGHEVHVLERSSKASTAGLYQGCKIAISPG